MRYQLPAYVYCGVMALYLSACDIRSQKKLGNTTPDTSSIRKGRELFNIHCSTCHHLNRDGIGPQLAGVADSASKQWLQKFISNPQRMFDSGDTRTRKLVSRYKAIMPAFDHLTSQEISQLISLIQSMDKVTAAENLIPEIPVEDPIPGIIPSSDIYVEAEFVTRIPSSAGGKKGPVARITKMDYRPGDRRLFVADMRGKLYRLDASKPAVFLNLSEKISGFVHEPDLVRVWEVLHFIPNTCRMEYYIHPTRRSRE